MKKALRIKCVASRRRAAALLGAGMLACPMVVRAATATWTGGDPTFGTFTQPNNWGGTLPANNGSAALVFGSANPHGYSPTLNGNFDANSLTFNTSALSFNIVTNGSGFSGVLSLEDGGLTDNASNLESLTGSTAVVVKANQTWNIAGGRFVDSTPLNLSSNTLTVNTSATGSASFTGTLNGVLGSTTLVKTGPGMLNLNASSSMVGNVSLQAGTMQQSGGGLTVYPFAGTAMTVTGAATFNVNSGAAVVVHAFITGAAGLIVDGGSTVVVTGPSQLIATDNSPAIQVGYNTSGAIAVSAGAFFNATTLSLGAGVGSTGTATVDGNSTINLNTLIVASLATSTGSLTITNGGTVTVASLTYFGSNNSSISISTGGGSLNTAGLSSDVTGLGSIALTDPSGGYALNINGSSGTNPYSGSISGTGSLNKSGGSTQILSGSDSFSGKVLITGGTLALGSSNLFSQLTIGTGGTLELNPSGGFSSSLPINFDGGTFAYNASNATLANPINLTANGGTVNVSSGIILTTTGILNGASGTLTKTGPGTLNLALSNSSSNVISTLRVNGGLTQLTSGSLTIDSNSPTGGGLGLNGTSFNISGGAAFTAATVFPTDLDGGTVNVTGPGSSFATTSGLQVGFSNPGTLTLAQHASASTGQVLEIGVGNSGTLGVQGGSTVAATNVVLGFNSGATGIATVNGTGSCLTTSSVHLGGDGIDDPGGLGTLTISGDASVNVSSGVFIDSAVSTINISGGTLTAGSVSNPNGGGTILLTDPSGNFALNINGSSGTQTYSGAISGAGSLNKSGGSTQILSGSDTFTGNVMVSGGTLILNSANTFSSLNVTAGTAQVSAGTLSLSAPGTIPFFVDGPTAVLNVSNGAVINATSSSFFYVPARIDNGGTVNVSGAGSLLTTPNANQGFDVGGFSGANVLNLSGGGGLASANYVEVGGYQSGTSGTLNIGSGGSVTAALAAVGLTAGTTGSLNINGSGAVLNVSQNLEVGGSPELGGTGGTALITVTNGGAINTPTTTFYSNTAIISISGGTLTTQSLYSNSSGNGAIILTDPASGFALNINGVLGGNSAYSGSISGTGSLEKTGRGLQVLEGTDTFTGSILVTGGILAIDTPVKISSLVITGGTVQVTGTGNILTVPTLAVIGGGTLDITNDSADISASSLAVVTALAQKGFNNGLWTGSGLTSNSAVADTKHLTAVGVIQNNQGGTPLYTASHPFEGTTPGVSDILAKYTYYGDTNLDGKVDGSDYSRIDSAFIADKTNPTAVTGWYNGDFNYDGVINGSDYTLIDNAFNTQGALISAEFATPTAEVANLPATAVPEPGSMSLLLLAGLLSRRSRRRSTT